MQQLHRSSTKSIDFHRSLHLCSPQTSCAEVRCIWKVLAISLKSLVNSTSSYWITYDEALVLWRPWSIQRARISHRAWHKCIRQTVTIIGFLVQPFLWNQLTISVTISSWHYVTLTPPSQTTAELTQRAPTIQQQQTYPTVYLCPKSQKGIVAETGRQNPETPPHT